MKCLKTLIVVVCLLVATGSFAQDDKEKEKKLPQVCAHGQVAKWQEADPLGIPTQVWVCADDIDTTMETQVNTNTADIATNAAGIADLQAQDNIQQNQINAEVAARQVADGELQSQIDAEAAGRQAADDDLQGQIDLLGEEISAIGADTFVVNSDPIEIGAGEFQVFGYADCPSGSVVTGGGYSFAMFFETPYDPSKIWLKQSRPEDSSWLVEVWNTDTENPQPPFTVYAVCLPR